MRVMYVTANVLGDAGANAAELFPRFAFLSDEIDHVIVADFYRNKDYIRKKQLCEFLRLKFRKKTYLASMKNAFRIARKSKQANIDIIHVFYRQVNNPLVILLRVALIAFGSRAKVMVDHRSVNLAKGWKRKNKNFSNFLMQIFVHHLAGNPLAVETNHYKVWRPKHIIDLGFDKLPEVEIKKPDSSKRTSVWFIGSLKPKNRKSEFLIKIFDEIYRRFGDNPPFDIHVAGPTTNSQGAALMGNPIVKYYGSVPRNTLYELLIENPGIGMAFMNQEFHAAAPSLKFSEYAAMKYAIVASDTVGLKTQWRRMKYGNVTFAEETVSDWVEKLIAAAEKWPDTFEAWETKDDWSYESIFNKQVIKIYQSIVR